MAITNIGSLWIPANWLNAVRERQATFPALFNSPVVVKSPIFTDAASGAGTSVNIPLIRDITDTDDELQSETAGPQVVNGLTSGIQVAAVTNRVAPFESTALAKQLSAVDPVKEVSASIAEARLKQRQKTLIAMLRGLFASAGASGAAGCMTGMRYVNPNTNAEPFSENGRTPSAEYKMDGDVFVRAKAMMGELAGMLKGGCMLIHPNVKAGLEIIDGDLFNKAIVPSELPFEITTYRGIPLFESESLARAGTAGGYVYDTYLLAGGTVGYGEKPQAGNVVDVASLQYYGDPIINKETIYDRTRFMMAVAGTKWVGTPADANMGPTNAEFQTAANWELVTTAGRVGAVCIRTNG